MFRPLAFAFVAASLLLASCSKEGGSQPDASAPAAKVKLGFLVKQPEEPWFQLEWQFADEAAKKLGFDLVKIGTPDGEKVLSAIDNLAAQGAQGFIICTPDTTLGPAIVARAKAKNLKLLAVDDRFLGADGKPMEDVHYLGISAGKIGQSVGVALFAEQLKRGWQTDETGVLAVTFDELATARERTDGAIEALTSAGFPANRIFKAATQKPEIPAALDATNALLTQHGDVKQWLVCGPNDNCVLGAVRALEGRGFGADSVVAIGINGTDCIIELEKQNPTGFYSSVLLSAKQHGYQTCEMLYHWIKDGVEPPFDTRTTGVLINRGNFKQVLKEQGITH
ncbi:MAG: arabinose ABC transporter substrate-binding protein [Planctomycetes bacterium]|nr:arabinose ABC transporter substrate-binding protein [Planctomycetota bacterium]